MLGAEDNGLQASPEKLRPSVPTLPANLGHFLGMVGNQRSCFFHISQKQALTPITDASRAQGPVLKAGADAPAQKPRKTTASTASA